MTKISQEELLKLAAISFIEFVQEDIVPLQHQIQAVLSYAVRVQEVARDVQDVSQQRVNVFREDVIIKTDSHEILQCAPDQLENYFVVPKIIETN